MGGCGVEVEVEVEGDGYGGCLGDGRGGCSCWVRVRGLEGGVALALVLVLILRVYLLRAGLNFFPPRLGGPEIL